MKLWLRISMILAALVILYVSFTRAGLERVTLDEKYDQLRKVEVFYQDKSTGDKRCYKLPESRTLPNNPTYLLKKIRDELWINLSWNPIDKSRITILIADKKVEEALILYKKGTGEIYIKNNLEEAIKKMDKARLMLGSLNQNDIEVKKMKQKIDQTNSFYQYIIEQVSLNKKIVNCNE